jgi:hypothetical protein
MNCGSPAPSADVNRVVAFFLNQFIDGYRPAHDDVGLELDAHFAHVIELLADNLLGQAEFRNAVHQHSTQFVQRFKYANLVTLLDQVPATVSPEGPLPTTAIFLSCRRHVRHNVRSHALFVVGDKALQISNPERLHLLRQQAFPFAMIFLGTHAPVTAGRTLSSRILAAAPRKSPITIFSTNSFTFTPTGQLSVQVGLAHSRQRSASCWASSAL